MPPKQASRLPRKAPHDFMVEFGEENFDTAPCALYVTCRMSDEEISSLLKAINDASEAGPDHVVRASRPRFVQGKAQAVYTYHLSSFQGKPKAERPAYNPLLFVIANNRDWKNKGIRLVSLDSDEEDKGKIGSCNIKFDDVSDILASLALANTSFEEVKETQSFRPAKTSEEGGEAEEDGDEKDEGKEGEDDDYVDAGEVLFDSEAKDGKSSEAKEEKSSQA